MRQLWPTALLGTVAIAAIATMITRSDLVGRAGGGAIDQANNQEEEFAEEQPLYAADQALALQLFFEVEEVRASSRGGAGEYRSPAIDEEPDSGIEEGLPEEVVTPTPRRKKVGKRKPGRIGSKPSPTVTSTPLKKRKKKVTKPVKKPVNKSPSEKDKFKPSPSPSKTNPSKRIEAPTPTPQKRRRALPQPGGDSEQALEPTPDNEPRQIDPPDLASPNQPDLDLEIPQSNDENAERSGRRAVKGKKKKGKAKGKSKKPKSKKGKGKKKKKGKNKVTKRRNAVPTAE